MGRENIQGFIEASAKVSEELTPEVRKAAREFAKELEEHDKRTASLFMKYREALYVLSDRCADIVKRQK